MREPFSEVGKVAGILRGFRQPWFFAGGWAIDLFLGRVTRDHEDIEIAILRDDQGEIHRYLIGWELDKVVQGTREPWRGERLDLPVHELHATGPGGRLEILIDEGAGDLWRFRRNLAVTRPLARVGLRTREGIPFLAPEVVILYKAKDPRPRDEQDFAAVLPELDDERRRWLGDALRVCHRGHPWIARLAVS